MELSFLLVCFTTFATYREIACVEVIQAGAPGLQIDSGKKDEDLSGLISTPGETPVGMVHPGDESSLPGRRPSSEEDLETGHLEPSLNDQTFLPLPEPTKAEEAPKTDNKFKFDLIKFFKNIWNKFFGKKEKKESTKAEEEKTIAVESFEEALDDHIQL